MNHEIQNILSVEKPLIQNLSDELITKYERCLKVLGLLVSENFFDIPRLRGDRFTQEGYFYEIPYFDSNQLWESDNQIMLVVVYDLKNKSSFCPLRIDMKLTDENNFGIYVYDQSGERTTSKTLLERVDGVYYTEIVNYSKISLYDLLKEGVGFERL